MNNLNSHLNQQIHNQSQFDPTSSHDEFLHHMMSLSSAFPWADDQTSGQHQISGSATMFQQQLMLSRSIAAANDRDDVVDRHSLNPDTTVNDASIEALFSGFTDSLGQTTNQAPHFHHSQADSFGVSAAATAAPAAGQPRQRVRARRGQATDPHSIAERLRRERIAERMKALQELVPNANRTDKASMLDEIIDYVKFLRLQVKVLSTSRLGGVAAVAPLLGDGSTQKSNGRGGGEEGMEQKVAKLLEEDMGSAMQYLQGKGLCLMPISLASTISTQTSS